MTLERAQMKMSSEGMARMLLETGTNYTGPLLAWKEYFTNHVDAIFRGGKGSIDVSMYKGDSVIVSRDDAAGMSREKAMSLPKTIGESDKIERQDERGEKAIGLLAYAALRGKKSSSMDIVTKLEGDHSFSLLRYGIENNRLVVDTGIIGKDEVNDQFYGAFDHGTRFVVRPDPLIFKEHFGENALKRFIQSTYTPLLVKGNIPITFTGNSGKTIMLESPDFKGEKIMKGQRDFEARVKLPGGGIENHNFPVYLHLFVNPEKKGQKVGVFAKDVRVQDSLTQMEPRLSANPLWGCGNVFGYVNSDNLMLTLGREGLKKSTQAYKHMVSLLDDFGNEKWPEIQEMLAQGGREVANKKVMAGLSKLKDAYQHTKPLDVIGRNRPGGQNAPIDTPTGEVNPNPRENVPRPPRRQFGFNAMTREFDLSERDRRSMLEHELNQQVILVNSGHPDYIAQVVNGSSKQAEAYALDVMAPMIAQAELTAAESKGKNLGDESERIALVLRRAQDLKYAALNGGGR